MLKDADPNSFSGIYLVCGYTDLRYGIDSLATIIETKYHLPLFAPGTLFLFCGRKVILPATFEPPVRTLRATIPVI